MKKKIPSLLLGTAQFGWNINRQNSFELLDAFYESGFRQIDSATNYPINKISSDFRAAENILLEWIRINGIQDLRVMMKIGSLNNLRTPECNLSKSFLLMSLENYRNTFGENLDTLMVHWSNQTSDDEIVETISTLKKIQQEGLEIGLSGIASVEKFASFFENKQIYIQLKNNILQSDFAKYIDFFPEAKYITYGMNAGGVKLATEGYTLDSTLKIRGGDTSNQNDILKIIEQKIITANQNKNRPPIDSFFQVAMIHSFYNQNVYGLLVGNSSAAQWKNTFDFYKKMQTFDYSDVLK